MPKAAALKIPAPRALVQKEDVPYRASDSIGLLMRIALFGLRSSFKSTLIKHKIPWSAWHYLRVLWEADGITQSDLTQRVGAMQPNTVSTLRTMVKAGLAKVERDPEDRRSTRVWLTPKARRLMKRVLPEMRGIVREVMLVGFSEREEAELKRLMNKMCANVRTKPDNGKAAK
jgi:DNA-binding MarR family transcriptional regulator